MLCCVQRYLVRGRALTKAVAALEMNHQTKKKTVKVSFLQHLKVFLDARDGQLCVLFSEGGEEGEKAGGMDITDETGSKVLAVRRNIYLTIMSRWVDIHFLYLCKLECKIENVKLDAVFPYFCLVWTLKSVLTS